MHHLILQSMVAFNALSYIYVGCMCMCGFGFSLLCVHNSTVIFILLYQNMWFVVGTANT